MAVAAPLVILSRSNILIAGLAGLGISSGAAFSAVLIYRLATYWLPVPPGWLCLRQLQTMDYV